MQKSYIYAILAALFWGAGFIGSRFGLTALTPMWVTFLRFLIAALVLLPFILRANKHDFSRQSFVGASLAGLSLTLLMFFQVKGLQYTTVAKSSFITITYAFMTPLVSYYFFKEKLSTFFWSTLALALIGILFLCDLKLEGLNYGDFLTFIGALLSAGHILLVSHYAKIVPRLSVFNTLQMFSVAVFALIFALILEGAGPLTDYAFFKNHEALIGLVFMGIFSTSIAFLLQVKSQKNLSPHAAGLIFLLESPFAAFLGYTFFQEALSSLAIVGCFLVILGVGLVPFEHKIMFYFLRFKTNLAGQYLKARNFNYLSVLLLCFFL
jgi:drug/metabolite transporter (DMT)-like permease